MNKLFTDDKAIKFPISVKGIIKYQNKFLLRKNERNEWELLGGKLEQNEQPFECVAREIYEEAGVKVLANYLIDVWLYNLRKDINVLIVTYVCELIDNITLPVISPENSVLEWFSFEEIQDINIPTVYKNSLAKFEQKK